MFIFLNILIVTLAVIHLPFKGVADIFWMPKEAIYVLGLLILLAYPYITKHKAVVSFKNVWIGTILIYMVISFVWYFYNPVVFTGGKDKVFWNVWVVRPSLCMIFGTLAIKSLVENTDTQARWVQVAKTLCYVAFGLSVYAILQWLKLDPFYKQASWIEYVDKSMHYVYTITFFGQHTLTAAYISAVSPLCLMFRSLRFKLFYAVMFLAVVLCNSTLALFAFMVGLYAYLFFTRKGWSKIIIVTIFTMLIAFYLKDKLPNLFSFSGRLELWKDTLNLAKDSIVTGFGQGSFAMKKLVYNGKLALSSHSEPLQILYENGLIMITLLAGYFVTLFKRILVSEDNILKVGYVSGLLSFLVICLANFPLRIAPLALIGVLYISAIETQLQKE